MNKELYKGIFLIVFSSLCVCIGQLLWKIAHTEGINYIIIGFIFYGIGSVFMILSYKYGKVSILQPILGISYIFSLFLGNIYLQENISLIKCCGVFLILFGIFFLAKSEIK